MNTPDSNASADDPQVLEELIRDANPKYEVTHKWLKLYAHVPG
jgi:hypothetical protein